jgi:hypothetical protein
MATRRTRVGERRWPTAAAVLLTGALRITLPPQLRLNDAGPALFVVLLGLVIVLILADRGPTDRRATWRRVLTAMPIALITIANGGSTVRLVYGILFAEPFTQQARTLLSAGGVIWLTNVIAFALWYWDLDRGGRVRCWSSQRVTIPAWTRSWSAPDRSPRTTRRTAQIGHTSRSPA